MDYSRPALADRLAADYVAGTLRGGARRRFESLLGAHPALSCAVRAWEARLMPLTATLPPVQPSPQVWRRIEARLRGTVSAPARDSGWTRLALWRGLAGVASVAAIGMSVLWALPGPVEAPLLVVLSAPAADGGAALASFVASVSADGRAMVTRPLTQVPVQADRSLELWALPPEGAPRSLGVISPKGATVVQRGRLLDDTATLAVTLEPRGGSPSGKPTGPMLYVGKLGA